MPFPSNSELKRARRNLAGKPGTLMLPQNATALEKLRWDICQKFVIYKLTNRLTHEDLAKLLGTDKAKVSKILRHRIDGFSTDRLILMLQVIYPNTVVKVA